MHSVFIQKPAGPEPGFDMCTVLGRKPTAGQVGLEIEVEGNKFPCPAGTKGTHQPVKMEGMPAWSYVHDGSLRGADNAEYILTKPVEFKDVPKHIKDLWATLGKYGSIIDDSNRTSVHVHLNCQTFHLNRLTSLMALYFVFEEIFTEWCGEHRVGNLFCLRAKDAPAIISQIKRFIQTDCKAELRDHLHYSGLNANALHKFGSIEFRALRGCTEPDVIQDWVDILQRIYDLSAEYPDPRDICGLFSMHGPMAFFETVLGSSAAVIRKGTSMSDEDIRDSLYEGIRLAQDLCYCRDWERFKTMSMKPDPFGRDSRRIIKKIIAAAGSPVADSGPTFAPTFQATYTPEPEYDDDPEYYDDDI